MIINRTEQQYNDGRKHEGKQEEQEHHQGSSTNSSTSISSHPGQVYFFFPTAIVVSKTKETGLLGGVS
jgi:hypothetical protein